MTKDVLLLDLPTLQPVPTSISRDDEAQPAPNGLRPSLARRSLQAFAWGGWGMLWGFTGQRPESRSPSEVCALLLLTLYSSYLAQFQV